MKKRNQHSVILIVVIALVLTCLPVHTSTAQMIDNELGKAFTDVPYFNKDFIRHRGIKTISGQYIHYKLGDKLRETDFYKKFIFNRKGELILIKERSHLTSGHKTAIDYFEYDEDGNIVAHRHYDHFSAYMYLYTYDELGRVLSKEFRQNYHRGNYEGNEYVIGEEFKVSLERFNYQDYHGQQQQFVYSNDSDLPYKDVFSYFDNDGKLVEVTEKLRRASSSKSTSYHYNEEELIDSIAVNSRAANSRQLSTSFTYDTKGNLSSKREFINGEMSTKTEVIYNEETNLINDILIQNVATNFIRIIELRNYTHFDVKDTE